MKILLTGGSGAVGQNVLEQLCKNKDFEIIAFDIKNKVTQKFYKPFLKRITVHYGDISKKEDLIPVAKDVDFVIHLAAIIPPLADQKPELAHKINVEGTRNLIDVLEAHSKNAFLLYASSVSVYGDRLKNPFINVGDPLIPSPGDEYAKTKIKAEIVVQNSQLDWSIFRLSAIMGTDNHKISGLMFHMPLATSMEITTPKDTGRAFANAVHKRKELSKRIFNLGGGEGCRIDYHEFLSKSFNIFGLGKLNFPKNTFAKQNFHCGYYADGDELEEILQFRKDDIESYFKEVKKSVPPLKRFFTRIFNWSVKQHLIRQSDPLKAIKRKDRKLITHYFNSSAKES
ncbi:MAG TPA: NAD(P)-dependent oxidoreductase [Brumimicrobium sp.]|nr:NAD(P)-dependent oxidoreductase [Brumimicrobium sp.]